LLEVVSDRTGYPVDMLGLDLDLEGDLSIDSIKRMEIVGDLKDKLNLGDAMEASEEVFVKMASLKTLNELIAWIDELKSQMPSPAAVQTDATNSISAGDNTPVENTPTQKFDADHVRTTLLEVVSTRTGYPVDMLGLDLDLEGDLSIDSIKRMEIVGDLKEKLNLGDAMEASEEVFVKLASLKTLNEIINWVNEMNNDEASASAVPAASGPKVSEKEAAPQQTPATKAGLSRILFDLNPYPLKPDKTSIEGKHFAITDDGGAFAKEIKQTLEKTGVKADIVRPGTDITAFDGLVLVNAAASPNNSTVKDLFGWIHGKDLNGLKWVFTFSDVTGKIRQSKNPEDVKLIQGFSGLLKSLSHEYSGVKFRSVVSNVIFSEGSLGQIVLDELTADDDVPEVVYDAKGRCRYDIRVDSEARPSNAPANLKLDENSTVVVLGGAQGIAPELVAQLSVECPCRYILVGRSELPDGDKAGIYAGLKTQADIRKYLLTVEGMKIPAEIEKKIQKIFKSNQIAEAVRKIEAVGGHVAYHSVDITRKDDFKAFLRSVREQYGKIDGIIHSAGLLNDKFFADKTWDSFEKVYQTKINPLHVIIDEIDDDLKLLVLFSSIASSYGSVGQTDYASANSVFDQVASVGSLKPELRTLVFNWGPWKGAGMVSDSLEAEFTRRGVSMIPLKEGGAKFVDELKYGDAPHVIIMGGGEKVEEFLKSLGGNEGK
jgi:NAD(P)-dependent dehydrogenase (short-subunit alcohol dehydrogenase family)/acyl carrier protein